MHPLENYRAIAEFNFFSKVEERFYTIYYNELISSLHIEVEKDRSRMYVNGTDINGNAFDGYVTLTSYLLKEYDKLEKEARSNIDELILTILDEGKQNVFVKNIIKEVQEIQHVINGFSTKPNYAEYKTLLIRELTRFIELLQANLSIR